MQKPNLNMHDRNIRKENGFGHTVLEVYTSSHPFLTETFFKNFFFPFNISSFVVSEISSIASLGDWGSLKLLAYLKVISQSGRPLRSKSHKAISAIPSYQLWLASQKKSNHSKTF